VEEALIESEESFRTMSESSLTGVYIFVDGMVEYANPTYAKMLGYTTQEMIGMDPLDTVHPDDRDMVRDRMVSRLDHKETISVYECRLITKDERTIFVSIMGTLIPYLGRRAISGNLMDITQRKIAEEALRQANRKLNLLSSITRHDINNQIQALIFFLDIAKDKVHDNAQLLEIIRKEEVIVDNIYHQISFTKDYEDLGVMAPNWQKVDPIIKRCINQLHPETVRIISKEPNLEIFADPLLQKVFYNLIDNAMRYGGEKMTTIRVSGHEENNFLIIEVEDDGDGVSVEDKKKLFSKGFGKHTGLGLFLSREILSITGITITENGLPGKGARFEILVPKGEYRFSL
jgi:PAS domain S-box-containing protein